MKKIILCMTLMLLFLVACGTENNSAGIKINDLKADEVKKMTGWHYLGDGNTPTEVEYDQNEIEEFISLLNDTQFGKSVSEEDVPSYVGASGNYTLELMNGKSLKIEPNEYFCFRSIDSDGKEYDVTYYKVDNYDKIWDKWVEFNSKR